MEKHKLIGIDAEWQDNFGIICLQPIDFETNNRVIVFNKKEKKPGLETFSILDKLEKHRSIEKRPLGNIEWSYFFENYSKERNHVNLDDLPFQHINSFWEIYNLKFAYQIEHKEEHLSLKTAYYGKGHYALRVYNKKKDKFCDNVKKIRGHKEYCEGIKNPMHILLENVLEGIDMLPPYLDYKTIDLLSVSDWRRKIKKDPDFSYKPGEGIESKRKIKINNNFMPFNYLEAFHYCEKRTNKPDTILFEKYKDLKLGEIYKKMILDNKEINQKKEILALKK